MANHGGPREGAGRPKGARTKITEEAIKRAGDGETPLEYMLRIMRDAAIDNDRRDQMALAAAPYVHAKQQEIELRGDNTHRVFSDRPLSEDEWRTTHQPLLN